MTSIVVAVVLGFGTVGLSSHDATDESLRVARQEAWAPYLGTVNEVDRIQPNLTSGPAPGPRATERWNAAFPDTKRQAAAVQILYDDQTSDLIDDLQDDLSVIDGWVQDRTWREDVPRDLDITAEVNHLQEVAQDSVGG